MKVLCVLGQHQYGNKERGLGTEYEAFLPALRRLGWEVVHFESWNRNCYRNYAELNQALLSAVEAERPEVMLAVQVDCELWLETLEIVSSRGDVATVCWNTDDSWKYRQVSRFIGHSYHAMMTTYPECLRKYGEDGIENRFLTQWAANADWLSEPLPAGRCRYPVSFVGAAHGNRIRRVAELHSRGIDVACFGQGWPAGPVTTMELREIVRRSVISLNFSNSKGANQIKARMFEVPAAGGCLLTEDAPSLESHFVLGEEVVRFDGDGDLAAKVRDLLGDPQRRDRIARAGFERTRRCHTYDQRMKDVLSAALASKDPWLSRRDKAKTIDFQAALGRHRRGAVLSLARRLLVRSGNLLFGDRGLRAARRLVFELSWRLAGKRAFTSAGLPGRMFPEV